MTQSLLDYFTELATTAEQHKHEKRKERERKECIFKKVLRRLLLDTKKSSPLFAKHMNLFDNTKIISTQMWKKILKRKFGDLYVLNLFLKIPNSSNFQMISNYTRNEGDTTSQVQIHKSYLPHEKSKIRAYMAKCINEEDCLSPELIGKWMCPALKKSLHGMNKKKFSGYSVHIKSLVSNSGLTAVFTFIQDVDDGTQHESMDTFTITLQFQLGIWLNTLPPYIKIPTIISKSAWCSTGVRKGKYNMVRDIEKVLFSGDLAIPFFSSFSDSVRLPKIETVQKSRPKLTYEKKTIKLNRDVDKSHSWNTDFEFIERYVYTSIKKEYSHTSTLLKAVKIYAAMAMCPQERVPKLPLKMKHALMLHMFKQIQIDKLSIMELLLALVHFICECVEINFCPSFVLPCTNVMGEIDLGGLSFFVGGLTFYDDEPNKEEQKTLQTSKKGKKKHLKEHTIEISDHILVINEEETRKQNNKKRIKKTKAVLDSETRRSDDVTNDNADMEELYGEVLNLNMSNNKQGTQQHISHDGTEQDQSTFTGISPINDQDMSTNIDDDDVSLNIDQDISKYTNQDMSEHSDLDSPKYTNSDIPQKGDQDMPKYTDGDIISQLWNSDPDFPKYTDLYMANQTDEEMSKLLDTDEDISQSSTSDHEDILYNNDQLTLESEKKELTFNRKDKSIKATKTKQSDDNVTPESKELHHRDFLLQLTQIIVTGDVKKARQLFHF